MKTVCLFKVIAIFVLGCCLLSCGDKTVEMNDISVNPGSVSIFLGLRAQITAIPVPLDATDQQFEWISENRDIVTVSRFGIVEAIGEGTTNITVKCGKLEKTIPVTVTDPIVIPQRTSSWLFDDPSDIGKAAIGEDLVPVGNGFTPADGPNAANGAVRIPKGSYFEALHGILPNGGGTNVNEYTLMVDFKVPALGRWYSFYQTDLQNRDDAEVFINTGGAIGVGSTGYSPAVVEPNKWSRLVISAKLGEWFRYYLDGILVHQTAAGNVPAIDDRFSLPEKIILFGDDDGDDGEFDIAETAFWNVPLDELQIKKLGNVK